MLRRRTNAYPFALKPHGTSVFLLNGPVEGISLDYGDLRVVALRPPSVLLHIFLLLEHYAYRDNSWFHLIFH